jgi:hypothetical protein
MPLSDMHGRAFEFSVTESILLELEKLYPGKVKTTPKAREAQRHGQQQFESLTGERRKRFEKSGRKIGKWLVENKLKNMEKMKFEKPSGNLSAFFNKGPTSEKISRVQLDRISDVAGVRGDVTDIRVKLFSKDGVATVNISLKHRHEALKHPRLTRVPAWIDLAGTREGKQYRNVYEGIWENFFWKGKELSPSAKRFEELRKIDPTFKEENLHKPLYTLVARFLQQNIKTSSQVQQMFDFIVGKFEFIKFVDHDGKIEVRDFSYISKPNSVEVEYEGSGYLYLQFDNGLRISGRLHTATQWLRKSIKFDMQPVNLDSIVPAIYISQYSQSLV